MGAFGFSLPKLKYVVRGLAGLVAVGVPIWCHPAQAQIDQDAYKLCARDDRATVEVQIGVCTRLLADGRGTAHQLANVYVNRGVARYKLGQTDAELADYEAALRLDPGNPMALTNRASALLEKKQINRALQDYAAALQPTPEDAMTALAQGMAHVFFAQRGEPEHYQAAIESFDAAIGFERDLPTLFLRRASANFAVGRTTQARQDYDEAIRLSPTYSDAFQSRAALREYLGDRAGALADRNQAVQLAPADPGHRVSRAWALRRAGRCDSGRGDYDQAVTLRQGSSDFRGGRGDYRAACGDFTGAIEDYTAALGLKPGEGWILYDRALARERLGQDDLAAQDYAAVATLPAETGGDLLRRGYAELRRMQWAAALAGFRAALAMNAHDAAAQYALGYYSLLALQPEAAENWFTAAGNASPRWSTVAFGHGMARLLMGSESDIAAADAAFGRMIALQTLPDAEDWLWRALAAGRRARSEQALRGVLAQARLVSPDWPAPVVGFLLGNSSEEALLANARNAPGRLARDYEASARFWIAELALVRGQRDTAVRGLHDVEALHQPRMLETAAAALESKRLSGGGPSPAPAPGPTGGQQSFAAAQPAAAGSLLLHSLALGRWALNTPSACGSGAYTLDVRASQIVWRSAKGGVDVEQVMQETANFAATATVSSSNPGGSSEAAGTQWTYQLQGDGRVAAARGGRASFTLVRCP